MPPVLTTDQVMAILERKLRVGVTAAANAVRAQAVLAVNRSQPVIVVTAKKSGKERTVGLDPSKEGEPPKRLTNALLESIQVRETRVEGRSVIGAVGAGTKYARRLEFGFVGTDSAGRRVSQGPRPYMRPALEAVRPRLASIITRAAKNA